jgi:hypothetical protein
MAPCTKVYILTGCLSACEKNEYTLTPVTERLPADKLKKHQFQISLIFPTGRHVLKEQYVIYDPSSFIADVGGYLGLLLGHRDGIHQYFYNFSIFFLSFF